MASKQIKIGSNSGKLKKFFIASMKDKLHHTKGTAKEQENWMVVLASRDSLLYFRSAHVVCFLGQKGTGNC